MLGDLHPRNVLLRPDGRLCLIDLELAHDVDEPWTRSMGAPAFVAPDSATGFAVDRHALGAIRLWLFLPYTEMLRWDPDKAEELIEAAAARFELDDDWAAAVRRDLFVDAPDDISSGWRDRCWPRHALPRWEAVRDTVAGAIAASATPWRDDRLFPGDPEQFASGGLGLAYGAAGVVWALAEVGATVEPAHLDWLERHVAADDPVGPGLYDGLAGIAVALDRCGRQDAADRIVERLVATTVDPGDHTLFSGGPGVGLLRLHLAATTAGGCHLRAVVELAERGLAALADHPEVLPKAGLLRGWSGLGLLLVRLAEHATPGAERDHWLDAAERALAADLGRCATGSDGTVQFDEGWRMLPYVATGSAGVGIVLDQFLTHRPDSALGAARAGIVRAASTDVVIQCGLFNGRAGLVLFLDGDRTAPAAHDGAVGGQRATVRHHVARLAWHAVPHAGQLAFVGDQLARLSMDLGTGAAGVLLAIAAATSERPISLPFLRPAERR